MHNVEFVTSTFYRIACNFINFFVYVSNHINVNSLKMSNIVDSENKQIGIDAIIIDMNTMNPIGCKILTFLLSVIPFNL